MKSLVKHNNGSQYGDSSAVLNACREEYLENLAFRINKRTAEYYHQPFLWGLCDDICTSDIVKSDAINGLVGGTVETLDDSPVVEGGKDMFTEHPIVQDKGNEQEIPLDTDIPEPKKECGTQTKFIHTSTSQVEQKKPFVPYAIGCHEQSSGIKRTFNVKSDCDVYPSAIRAEARRKERTQCFSGISNDISIPSDIRPKGSCAKQTLTRVNSFRSTPSNRRLLTPLPSGMAKTIRHSNTPDFPIQSVIRYHSPSPRYHINEVGDQPNFSPRDRQLEKLHHSSANNHHTRNVVSSSKNNWVSEYCQKYPTYPSSAYIRGASQAVSRCRPFTCSSNRLVPSAGWLKSLMPSSPVLLSSRGSVDRSHNLSSNRSRTGHCGVCSLITPDGRCIPQIESAR